MEPTSIGAALEDVELEDLERPQPGLPRLAVAAGQDAREVQSPAERIIQRAASTVRRSWSPE